MTASVPCRSCGKYNRLFLPITVAVECVRCGQDLDAAALARLNAVATDPGTTTAIAALDRAIDATRRPNS